MGRIRKTVRFFAERKAFTQRLASDVLVAVERHLDVQWRMRADFDRDVTPVGILNVKGVVVDPGLLALQVQRAAGIMDDFPHGVWRAMNADGKHATEVRIVRPVLLDKLVDAIIRRLLDERNVVRRGGGSDSPRKAARPTHQMCVVEIVIIAEDLTPPTTEPAAGLQERDVSVEHDTVETIVTATSLFGITLAEGIGRRHGWSPGATIPECIMGSSHPASITAAQRPRLRGEVPAAA
ncbi:MAG: hypothetical protein QGF59_16160 [Pirellulaceae bacterium]|nr:hypothetical protein [Pirellulaceae bacterium]